PYRSVAWSNTGTTAVVVGAAIRRASGSAARELEMFGWKSGAPNPSIASGRTGALNFSTPGDALIGQEAVTGVITVGASDASSTTHAIEPFSSQGPSTIYTNFSTQTHTTRQTLDITGT